MLNNLLSLSRFHKSLLMLLADIIVLPLALYSAFVLRFSDLWPALYLSSGLWMFIWVVLFGPLLLLKFGLYRAVVRYIGWHAVMSIVQSVLLLAASLYVGAWFIDPAQMPRSVPLIFALVALVYVGGTRAIVRQYYRHLTGQIRQRKRVLIYGAGNAGVQLMRALQASQEYLVLAFIDDDSNKWKTTLQGVKVVGPESVAEYVRYHQIDRVLLAMPATLGSARKRVLDFLAQYPVLVQTMPAMSDLASGKAQVDSLRAIEIDELLGRDVVPPMKDLLTESVASKVVLVTGAGGSIGSELCRQIMALHPNSLILFDMSEYALYLVHQELSTKYPSATIVPVLGSVVDFERVCALMQQFSVQTVYHAAAYKHVPLVEHNIIEGVRNNVFGTAAVARAALLNSIERFVLISTDKAVRPTNVMGATKRLAEQVLQNLARDSQTTIFTMVRFGNVLGSSGSVVPVFREQLKNGGPITVTHPDITRYFMTIPEAASLVIQAGAMAHGGDVFVLDMGEPVRIVDLAKRMVHLSGLEVRDEYHPDGDIEIKFTGLRPGEKLYEELLIGAAVTGTVHPKIMRADERCLPKDELIHLLDCLEKTLNVRSAEEVRLLLKKLVPEFEPITDCVDWLSGSGFDTSPF
jgi:FlaA1/EpsC-like NDP-sugar epimerase